MTSITFHGIDVGLFEGDEDLVGRIIDGASDTPGLRNGDVLVVASKVVSLAEGRFVDLETVDVSPRARRIGRVTGVDEREMELILRESRLVGAIPVASVAGDHLRAHAADESGADTALAELPSLLVTVRNGRLCTNAGIDLSNSPNGTATLLPSDPNESARRIREELEDRAGVSVAVVVSDSELSYRGGSTDVAIGCSGIDPVDRNFGATDLYGNPKLGGVDLVADELAGAGALVSGQASERLPIVLVRGLAYDDGEGIAPEVGHLRNGFVPTLVQSARVKLAEKLPGF